MSPRRLGPVGLCSESRGSEGPQPELAHRVGRLPASCGHLIPEPSSAPACGLKGPHAVPLPGRRPCCRSISVQATFQYCSPGPGVERRHE